MGGRSFRSSVYVYFKISLVLLLFGLIQSTVGDGFFQSSVGFNDRTSLRIARGLLERTEWNGDPVSDKFCAQDAEGNCHWDQYLNALSKEGAPGFILAGLSLIAGPIFFVLRFCCCCCGGMKGRCAMSCISHSWRAVMILRTILIFLALGVLLGSIFGFIGNANANTGIGDMMTIVFGAASTIINRGTVIEHALQKLPYTEDASLKINRTIGQLQSYLTDANSLQDHVNEYNDFRSIAILISYALPLALLLVGVVAAVLHLRFLSICAALLCFTASFFIWLSFGTHLAVNEGFNDICADIALIRNDAQKLNINTTNPIDVITSCSNGQGLQYLEDIANEAVQKAEDTACLAVITLCNGTNAGCGRNIEGENCTKGNLESLSNMTMTDYQMGCRLDLTSQCTNLTNCPSNLQCIYAEQNTTLGECAVSCVNERERELANDTIYNIDLMLKYVNIIEDEIDPLLNCSFVKSAVDQLDEALCSTLNEAVKMIAVSAGIVGFLLIPGTIAMVLGFDRFKIGLSKQPVDIADIM